MLREIQISQDPWFYLHCFISLIDEIRLFFHPVYLSGSFVSFYVINWGKLSTFLCLRSAINIFSLNISRYKPDRALSYPEILFFFSPASHKHVSRVYVHVLCLHSRLSVNSGGMEVQPISARRRHEWVWNTTPEERPYLECVTWSRRVCLLSSDRVQRNFIFWIEPTRGSRKIPSSSGLRRNTLLARKPGFRHYGYNLDPGSGSQTDQIHVNPDCCLWPN